MPRRIHLSDGPDLEDLVWSSRDYRLESHIRVYEHPARVQRRSNPLRRLADRYGFDESIARDWVQHTTGANIPEILLKISGACLTEEMAEDIADLSKIVSVAVVVGGGDEITTRCKQLGIPVEKYGPWRVTTKEVLEVVVDVMTRMANYFAGLIKQYGGKAFPLVGTPQEPLIFADKLSTFPTKADGKEIEAGYFGVIPPAREKRYISNTLVERITNAEANEVPVVAALGHQFASVKPKKDYQPLNIDGDEAVWLIAHAVGAQEVLFVTPSGGVHEQYEKTQPKLMRRLLFSEFLNGRMGLVLDEGMRWKLTQGFRIVNDGRAGVALVSPDQMIQYILDRDRAISPKDESVLTSTTPPHVNGFYATTLMSI